MLDEVLKKKRRLFKDSFNAALCDKCSKHHYHHQYHRIIHEARVRAEKENRPLRILEIGIFKGASFEGFIEYFDKVGYDNFELYGVDIFVRMNPEDVAVLKHPKVKWFKGDSTLHEHVPNFGDDVKSFDIIIDDGLHTPLAQADTFDNYYPLLRDKGSYVVEDVWPFHLMDEKEKKHPWILQHPNSLTEKFHEELLETIQTSDSSEVREHDNREISGEPDSFLFQIIK